jgi:hypothetical protein
MAAVADTDSCTRSEPLEWLPAVELCMLVAASDVDDMQPHRGTLLCLFEESAQAHRMAV